MNNVKLLKERSYSRVVTPKDTGVRFKKKDFSL